MGEPTGFINWQRTTPKRRPIPVRVADWREVYEEFPAVDLKHQAGRCMDCGIPFCNNGCPLGNLIPDWNDLVYRDNWRDALDRLHATNNFPEFTGRLCPAPCESACVLGINQDPVAIKQVEVEIIDRAWNEGWVTPFISAHKTGKRVAVIGSGPAGLAAAQQLTRAGHDVVVLERDDRIGGLLRYGIPEFKMEKRHIDRRVEQMTQEGTEFRVNAADNKADNKAGEKPDMNAGVMVDGRITHMAQQVCWVWQEVPVPVIAAVHGHALGGGIQIALGADIRIVHPDTQLSVREVHWGLIPDMTGTLMLSRLVRPDIVKNLVFTARVFSGHEAHEMGIATQLSQDVHADAMTMAREIAGRSPEAVRAAKKLINLLANSGAAEQFAAERETIGRLIGTANQAEAVISHFEKRPPNFVSGSQFR